MLIFRIWQYIGTIYLYQDIQSYLVFLEEAGILQILGRDYKPEIDMVRRIGVSQVGSDYSKYALGYYQL